MKVIFVSLIFEESIPLSLCNNFNLRNEVCVIFLVFLIITHCVPSVDWDYCCIIIVNMMDQLSKLVLIAIILIYSIYWRLSLLRCRRQVIFKYFSAYFSELNLNICLIVAFLLKGRGKHKHRFIRH